MCTCGHLAIDDHLHTDGGGGLALLFKELKHALQRHKQELEPAPPPAGDSQAYKCLECSTQGAGSRQMVPAL